jgi:SagB-type dehydrogenase family enzyme
MPRTSPNLYEPLRWPVGALTALPPRSEPLQVDMVALLEQRQSRRSFNRDLTALEMGDFLWLACRSRSSRSGPFGFPQESRPHPSAGGMHPIHVLVARSDDGWMRYDPVEHALIELPGSRVAATLARKASTLLVPLNRGVLIALTAEHGRTAAKYEKVASLVWRDAGVVLGYMSVVAEALGLSFCPLGILGEPYVSAAVANDSRVQAAGLAVLGAC